ncbi:MAG: pentapeptide repeat-containing protein [Ferruginibacter sp.]
MERADIYKQVFNEQHFSDQSLAIGDYEKCEFFNCDFSGSNLSKIYFTDCDFSGCNFSNAKLADTAFRNVTFTGCKMLGLHFEDCNKFLLEMSFDGCVLNHSSFYQLTLKKGIFNNCSMHEVDFTEAELPGSSFLDTDLAGAVFEQTNLQEADLRTARNWQIKPEVNNIKKAHFSVTNIQGLVAHYDIDIS